MKQIVIISGKGGTGKTVITGAFAALAKNHVMADCDVDAADLHLLLKPDIKERHEFRSGKTAVINRKLCRECGKCMSACRFDAIDMDFKVDPVSCEGCAFCYHVCPADAIKMEENLSGEWFVSDTRFASMVHAKLGIAEENSGKLVTLVRNKARELAEKKKSDLIMIDGSPGIGCPVIASIAGVDYAVVVTEPTMSGLHDADRVIKMTKHFGVTSKLIINKYDLNSAMAHDIIEYCRENNVEVLGKVSFDKAVVEAMVIGRTIVEQGQSKAKKEILIIWERIKKLI